MNPPIQVLIFSYKVFSCILTIAIFVAQSITCQNQNIADSLQGIYERNILEDTAKLDLLRELSFNENDIQLALQYAEELIIQAKSQENESYLFRGYQQKGNKLRMMGNYEEALDAYFKSLQIAIDIENLHFQGAAFTTIADVYSVMEDYTHAGIYYNKSIKLIRETFDSITLGTALINAGDNYVSRKEFDSALLYLNEAGIIFEKINYPIGTALYLGNAGMVYAEQGEDKLAEININKAIKTLEELGVYYPICVYLTYLYDIYLEKEETKKALAYLVRSLRIAEQNNLKPQIRDSSYKLYEYYEKTGNIDSSFAHYKNYIVYKDSITNVEKVQEIAELRGDFEVAQKQAEINLLEQRRKNQRIITLAVLITLVLIILLTIGLYNRYKYIESTNIIIEREKNKSEMLLLNILPKETAEELKLNGKVQSKKFDSVTVLFTDFKEFTKLTEHVEPELLVKSIDYYFGQFDEITTKYELEKIKTIGDSYMCAGGLPTINMDHALNAVKAAEEMLAVVTELNEDTGNVIKFDIRIGLHTGPVIAGTVGKKKWQYDIWGDTVNIASRMESTSDSGRINLSEATFNLIKEKFNCEYRGEVAIKNHGVIKMYFLAN